MFLRFAQWLDRITVWICLSTLGVLVSSVLTIVILRYGFGTGFIKLQDAASYAFALLLVFAVPITLARNGHVRVDIISERLGVNYLRNLDLLGLFFMLIPTFALLIWAWWPSLKYSWSIQEAAVETGGLAGLYLIKTTLPLAAFFTIIQGIAFAIRQKQAA